jgi:hypothetical protein
MNRVLSTLIEKERLERELQCRRVHKHFAR